MDPLPFPRALAFHGPRLLAEGPLPDVALAVKRVVEKGQRAPLLVFDADSSVRIDLNLSGSEQDVLSRLEPPRRGPGRPRLGVIAREITLLPRHWDWLGQQPGGPSVTLRKLVDQARKAAGDADRIRQARESAYRFIVAMAGDRPGFEEACRALFAGQQARFNRLVSRWPADIRTHARALMARAAAEAPDRNPV
jgi:hypothetical protein